MNEKLLKAHNKNIRLQGTVYRILAFRLGNRVLADAEPLTGHGARVNLVKTRSTLGMSIRNLIDLNLFV